MDDVWGCLQSTISLGSNSTVWKMLVLYIFNVSFWVRVSILTFKILNLSKKKVANGSAVDSSKITWCHNGAGEVTLLTEQIVVIVLIN